jgi:hypothetical protein
MTSPKARYHFPRGPVVFPQGPVLLPCEPGNPGTPILGPGGRARRVVRTIPQSPVPGEPLRAGELSTISKRFGQTVGPR